MTEKQSVLWVGFLTPSLPPISSSAPNSSVTTGPLGPQLWMVEAGVPESSLGSEIFQPEMPVSLYHQHFKT